MMSYRTTYGTVWQENSASGYDEIKSYRDIQGPDSGEIFNFFSCSSSVSKILDSLHNQNIF